MNRLRAFIALNVPVHTIRRIAEFQRDVQKRTAATSAKINWVPPANMHVTLKFLGEISQESVSAIEDRLRRDLQNVAPIALRIADLGAFPSWEQPRVIWLGAASPTENDISRESDAKQNALTRLAQQVESALVELGFDAESRPFHGHITLGRVTFSEGLASLIDAGQTISEQCVASDVVLYQSVLQRAGAEYVPLFKLQLPLN